MTAITKSINEVFERVLGYFGGDKNSEQGPTLLGMETPEHRKVPSAKKIKKAVEEVKELYKKAENNK
jgi:hypothetical protein